MTFVKAITKKGLGIAGVAIATAAATGAIYFMKKNMAAEVVEEIIKENKDNVTDVNFKEVNNNDTEETEEETEEEEETK